MTAFLCLVVAHLEWPLMMSSSNADHIDSTRHQAASGLRQRHPWAPPGTLIAVSVAPRSSRQP
jgi:hypothetical protein